MFVFFLIKNIKYNNVVIDIFQRYERKKKLKYSDWIIFFFFMKKYQKKKIKYKFWFDGCFYVFGF